MLVSKLRNIVSQCLLFAFLTVTCGAANAQSPNTQLSDSSKMPGEECHLIFGWDLIKPYQYFDASGQVVGLQIDLVKIIAQELGCTIEYRTYPWDELVKQLKNGGVDFMADATVTDQRKEFGYFSDHYRQEVFSLYVRRDDYENYQEKSLQELLESGFILGLTDGFVYADEVERFRLNPDYRKNFSYANSNLENYQGLLDKKIDGFLEDSLIAGYTLRNSKMKMHVTAWPNEIYRTNISFLFSKKKISPEFVVSFNQLLASLKSTKEYEKGWLRVID